MQFEFHKVPIEVKDDGVIFVDTMEDENGNVENIEGSEKFYPSNSVIVLIFSRYDEQDRHNDRRFKNQ